MDPRLRDARRRRLLGRWYPATWCERYGDELVDLLADAYGGRRLPLRVRWSLAVAGSRERVRAAGLVGRRGALDVRLRSALLVVLVAWTFDVVGGSYFAKYIEHWSSVTPAGARTVSALAITSTQTAAGIGAAACVTAVVLSLRPLGALIRVEGFTSFVRRCRGALVAIMVAASSTAGVVVAARRTTVSSGNSVVALHVIGLAWCAVLVTCLGVGVTTVGRTIMRLEYRTGELRALSALALTLSGSMVVILASTVAWWAQMASHARWFFASGVVGTPGPALPVPLIIIVSFMSVGVIVATWGAVGVVTAWREVARVS